MAQEVHYAATDIDFREGPFVAVNACGYRVEVEYRGTKKSCLPDITIYLLLRKQGFPEGKTDFEMAARKVDFLNEQVRKKNIVRIDGWWRVRE